MPTYEYRCDNCGHEFETFQSITAGALKKCPACGKHKLQRLIGTGAAILFRGSGFYETDYRSREYKKQAEADKPGDKKKSDSGGKSDSSDSSASSSKSGSKDSPSKSGD